MGAGLMAAVCLGSACTGGQGSGERLEPRSGETSCSVMGGPQAMATGSVAATCVGCRVDGAQAAADGELESYGVLYTDAAILNGVSLRVTRQDTIYPAGRRFGAMIRELRSNSFAANPYLFLRTYLDDQLQDEFVVGFSMGINTGAPPDLRIIEGMATKDFDAIEVAVGGSAMAGDFSLEVMEMCQEVTGGDEPPGNDPNVERPFAPAESAIHWTQKKPGPQTTAEMRHWFALLESAADSGEPLSVPVSYFAGSATSFLLAPSQEVLDVVLSRSKMLGEETFFQINTMDYAGPFVRIYEGHAAGNPNSLVHLTLADDFMRGAARINDDLFLIRIGTEGNLPAELAQGGSPAYVARKPASGEPVGCPADDIPNNNQDLPNTNGGHRLIPPYLSPEYALGIGDAPELEARIILDADLAAYREWGRHLPAMMIAMQVEQALTYRHEVGIRFRITGVHLNTIKGYYPEPLDTPATFDYMESWWGHYQVETRDIVHLLTGQPINTYMASCIGAAGSAYGYFYTSTHSETAMPGFRNMNFISHEIGHLFSAHHHYANHAESPGSATLMLQGYTPGDMPVFSSLSRGVIRGWAEEYLVESAD